MDTRIRLSLCQINQSVGDLAGNADRLRAGVEAARGRGADLVVFPELSITGYPPEDLLLKPSFVRDAGRALDRVAAAVTGIVAVVGAPVGEAPTPAGDAPAPLALYNGAAVLADGATAATYRKHHLPNYAVFDERRYFAPRAGRRWCWISAASASESACARTSGHRAARRSGRRSTGARK